MPSTRLNYLTVYKNDSQVYGAGSKQIALESPPPSDSHSLEDKRVFFITYQPDEEVLSVHQLPQDEVLNAELKYPKSKQKKKDEDDGQEASDHPPSPV